MLLRMTLSVWNHRSTITAFLLLCYFGTVYVYFADGFVLQLTEECLFSYAQEMGDVEFTYVFAFNKQKILFYNQTAKRFLQPQPNMGYKVINNLQFMLNKNKIFLKWLNTAVDTICRNNMIEHWNQTAGRTAKPSVTIEYLIPQSSAFSTRLVCHANGFYPGEIILTWFRNGEEYPDATTTAILPNGDWTYQVKSYVEFTPHMMDEYMCAVKHISSDASLIVKWDPRMDIFKHYFSIIATVVFIIGILSCFAGLIFWRSGFSSYGYQPLKTNLET
ncbi:class II histocompatibility antigen, M beta 1 chain-like [Protopterus annectens]|uniref:class II histocompatibility antigen, M beta 1 chain-like n=1 Tax=Protopterus annectens TaxID=7888 RepID=UPI001CFB1C84|nr:class II histocompatibility antigen, M beta 1 chain-like [Protopterus annectens]